MATYGESGQKLGDREREDGHLTTLVSLPYFERITQFIRGSTRHVSHGITVLDFRPLYAIRIHHIQRQLAKEIRDISQRDITDGQFETIRQLLERYSTFKPTNL